MTIGTPVFLIALGGILAAAINATVAGFLIQTAGGDPSWLPVWSGS